MRAPSDWSILEITAATNKRFRAHLAKSGAKRERPLANLWNMASIEHARTTYQCVSLHHTQVHVTFSLSSVMVTDERMPLCHHRPHRHKKVKCEQRTVIGDKARLVGHNLTIRA